MGAFNYLTESEDNNKNEEATVIPAKWPQNTYKLKIYKTFLESYAYPIITDILIRFETPDLNVLKSSKQIKIKKT